jgi:hypothetical protein
VPDEKSASEPAAEAEFLFDEEPDSAVAPPTAVASGEPPFPDPAAAELLPSELVEVWLGPGAEVLPEPGTEVLPEPGTETLPEPGAEALPDAEAEESPELEPALLAGSVSAKAEITEAGPSNARESPSKRAEARSFRPKFILRLYLNFSVAIDGLLHLFEFSVEFNSTIALYGCITHFSLAFFDENAGIALS